MDQYDGILAVNKPAGWTSHDVVAKLRSMLRMKRIGHAGTLDPDVTGVLPVALGRSTRFIEYMQEMPKEYIAEMKIGFATDTEDMSGEIIARAEQVKIDPDRLQEVISQFIGEIEQVPPMYSAVKVDGRRLYELAREGRVVERKARIVTIHELQLEATQLEQEYPMLRFRVRCSKGTYVRTLCKDIGEALGYPAVMSSLVRTMSCGVPISQAADLSTIAAWHEEDALLEHILSADEVLTHIPARYVERTIAQRLLHGQRVRLSDIHDQAAYHGLIRLYDDDRQFVGICKIDEGRIIPQKMFHI